VAGLPQDWGAASFGLLTWDSRFGVLSLTVPPVNPASRGTYPRFDFYAGDIEMGADSFQWKAKHFPSMALHASLSADRGSWTGLQAINTRPQQGAEVSVTFTTIIPMVMNRRVPVESLPADWNALAFGFLHWDAGAKVLQLRIPSADPGSTLVAQRFDFTQDGLAISGTSVDWPSVHHPSMHLQGSLSSDKRSVLNLRAVLTGPIATPASLVRVRQQLVSVARQQVRGLQNVVHQQVVHSHMFNRDGLLQTIQNHTVPTDSTLASGVTLKSEDMHVGGPRAVM